MSKPCCCCFGGCWAAIGGVVRGTDTAEDPDLSSLMVDSSNPAMTEKVILRVSNSKKASQRFETQTMLYSSRIKQIHGHNEQIL